MAEVLKLQSTSGIFDYPDSAGTTGTTEDQYMEFVKNHHTVLESTVHISLWQPDTDYKVGEVVISPNMVANTVARVSTAGHSSTGEPAWVKAGNAVPDGTVTWQMMPRTLDFATDSEMTAGTAADKLVSPKTLKAIMDTKLALKLSLADYAIYAHQLKRNTAYAVGDIAYSPNLKSYLYLECITAGTTGATEPTLSTLSGGGKDD